MQKYDIFDKRLLNLYMYKICATLDAFEPLLHGARSISAIMLRASSLSMTLTVLTLLTASTP